MHTALKNKSSTADLTFGVDGMTCVWCVTRVKKALEAVPGVLGASVNLATEKGTVQAKKEVPFHSLSSAVEKAG